MTLPEAPGAIFSGRRSARARGVHGSAMATWAGVEPLESRILLTTAPTFAIPLEDQVLSHHNAVTIGVDGDDAEGDPVTVTAVSSQTDLLATVSDANRLALMHFEDHLGNPIGTIVIEVFETRGGNAAAQFIALATMNFDANGDPIPGADPFHTDVDVHRVAELAGAGNGSLIIQTGDAVNGNGTGGSNLGEVADQFNLQDCLSFGGGHVVAMANSGPDSQDSQFFITDDPTTHLNGRHMIIGHVISGQEVIDFIAALPRDVNNRPIDTPTLASIDIVANTQDATITFKAVNGFVGEAMVTVTLDDGQGNQTQQQINVGVLGFDDSDITIDPGQSTSFTTDPHGNAAENQTVTIAQAPAGPTVDLDDATLLVDVDIPANFSGILGVTLNAVQDNQPLLPAAHSVYVTSEAADTPVPIHSRAATNPTGAAFAQRIDGNIMYVANGTRGIEIFDISDPADPQFLGGFITGGESRDIELVDYAAPARKVAFVADSGGGMLVLDVTDPANITQLHRSRVDPSDPTKLQDTVFDVEVDVANMIAWVADGDGGIASFDVSDPDNIPDKLDELPLVVGASPADTRGIVLNGDIAYGTIFNFGIVAYDIDDATDIGFGFTQALTSPWGMTRAGNDLYVVEVGSGGAGSALTVFDISVPDTPAETGTLPLTDTPWQVGSDGTTAAVGHFDGGFSFIDVNDPDNLRTLHFFDAPRGVVPSFFGDEMMALPIDSHGVLLVDGDNLTLPEITVQDDTGADITSSVNPADEIDFGTVLIGQAGPQMTFTIVNEGTDTLDVTLITPPAGFTLAANLADSSLAPGQAEDFTISLDSVIEGVVAGIIEIDSNDGDEDPFSIPVTGEVTARQLLGDFDGQTSLAPFFINGVEITLSLKGDGQAMAFERVDGSIEVEATGTTLKTTLAGKTNGGSNNVDVNLVTTDGSFGKIDFDTGTLVGDVLIAQTAKAIEFDTVADQHVIDVGPPISVKDAITFIFGRVSELTINTLTPIKALTVIDWMDIDGVADVITAPWVGKITTKGAAGVAGDFMAGLVLSGVGATKATLAGAKIAGKLSDAVWNIVGDVGTVASGDICDFELHVASLFKSLKGGVLSNVLFDVDDAGKLAFTAWDGGSFDGASLKGISTKSVPGTDGDIDNVDITITGSANPKVKDAFGGAKIAGDLTDSTLTVTGSGKAVAANVISNFVASLTGPFAGIKTAGDASVDITALTIKSVSSGARIHDSTITATEPFTEKGKPVDKVAAKGLIEDTTVTSPGNISSVKGTGLHRSQIYAGIGPLGAGEVLPDTSTAADFLAEATIKSVALKPAAGGIGFLDSAIAGWIIGKAALGVVQLDNGGDVHGLAADFINSLTGSDITGESLKLSKLDDPVALAAFLAAEGIDLEDLEIRLVV